MGQLLQQKDAEILAQRSKLLSSHSRLLTQPPGLQGEGEGPKRKALDELGTHQKQQSTAEITSQLQDLSAHLIYGPANSFSIHCRIVCKEQIRKRKKGHFLSISEPTPQILNPHIFHYLSLRFFFLRNEYFSVNVRNKMFKIKQKVAHITYKQQL